MPNKLNPNRKIEKLVLKPIRQSPGLCGPACLSSLLNFYGQKMSEKQVALLSGATKDLGIEPEAIITFLRGLGLSPVSNTNGTWHTLKKLNQDGSPVLVNWWSDYEEPADGHYSLVSHVTDKTITLMDPEFGGFRRMSKDKFMHQWYDYYHSGKKNTRWYLYLAN